MAGHTDGQTFGVGFGDPSRRARLQQAQVQRAPLARGQARVGASAGGAAKLGGAGAALSTAGLIPSPASPFLLAAGIGLQAVGAVVGGVEASKERKRQQAIAERQWQQQRQVLLAQLGQQKEQEDWLRRFRKSFLKGGGVAQPQQAVNPLGPVGSTFTNQQLQAIGR